MRMIRRFAVSSALSLALWPALAMAQATPAPLPAWDALTPAQRELLLAPLRERWDANPAERARMLQRAQRWNAMPAEQRARARHGMQRWEHMPPEKRLEARALFHAMRGMAPEQRKQLIAQWKQMTPEQRRAWIDANPPARPAPPRQGD